MVLTGVALDAVSVMALTGFATSAAMSLLIAMGGLALPPLGIASADPRVAQATSQVDAGLDAEKVKQLDAEAERLYKAGKYAEATAIAERSLAWREVELGPEHLYMSLPRFQGQCLESCFYTDPMKTNDHNECPFYASPLQR